MPKKLILRNKKPQSTGRLLRVTRSGEVGQSRQIHSLEIAGSSPASATNQDDRIVSRKIKVFELRQETDKFDVKASAVEQDDLVIDYKDVKISGFLSTFGNFDRDGETVRKGAFTETLERFRVNPIMLSSHRNAPEFVVGSFPRIEERQQGLYVEGEISNSPETRHIRFLVVEGHMKTLSMGGIFHLDEDGRTIFKVDLWEGSLAPIPSNPEATFSSRYITISDIKSITDRGMMSLIPASILQETKNLTLN